MPISLSALRKDRRSAAVEYAGETVAFTYRPSAMTPDFADFASRGGSEVGRVVAAIGELIESWDLVDDDGTAILPDAPIVRQLPLDYLNAVLMAALEDMQPKKPSA